MGMHLAIVGGGGIRTPLFVESVLARQKKTRVIDRVTLHDIQPRRLSIIEPMARGLIERSGVPLTLSVTTDLDEALAGADIVVTTVRAGFERGRILDERIALDEGCIGQETVGAGGFAMALRSIPVVLDVARRLFDANPGAWLLNFTNPAGIVTQALHDAGYERAIGICDSANALARDAAAYLGASPRDVRLSVFGLNHLSLAWKAEIGGEDVVPRLIEDDAFLGRFLALYEPGRLRGLGALPNEYLYYYLYADAAYAHLKREEKTRGEKVLAMNERFFGGAFDGANVRSFDELTELHRAVLRSRHETYMDYAWKETAQKARPEEKLHVTGEGYAGVALDFIDALAADAPARIVLNYRNGGAIPFFAHSDVAELSYDVFDGTLTPAPAPRGMDAGFAKLLTRVKAYENLTCLCARTGDRDLAADVLSLNPLVPSRAVAARLVERFTREHEGFLTRPAA
ncbi:6-phospho-beta-glucosidase [bacterium]|nr:6-phospho-beta-glucosidase [bacterium]